MTNIRLVLPSFKYETEIINYRQELIASNSGCDGTAGLINYEKVEDWLNHLLILNNYETCPAFFVPSTLYLSIDEEENVIGMIDIRHTLNSNLLNIGGHIGYNIRPSQRRKGYAKPQLLLALEKCRLMKITRVLITCDKTNIASKKVIIACGGLLENVICNRNQEIERYWLDLK